MGKAIADKLKALGQHGILITAAEQGRITEVACAMDECLCPHPMHRHYFEKRPDPPSDWAPSVDHWHHLKKDGGQLILDNIRLAHVLCNRIDYARNHGVKHDKDLTRVESASFGEVGEITDVYRHFLRNLGLLLMNSYLDIRRGLSTSPSPSEQFDLGRLHAYGDVVTLIKQQAETLGLETDGIGFEGFEAADDH